MTILQPLRSLRLALGLVVPVLAAGATACAPAPLDVPTEATSNAALSTGEVAPGPSGTANVGVSTATRIATVLGRLPACEEPGPGMSVDVDGLILPSGSVITDVTEEGNLTTVTAKVPLNPVEVRQFYEYQNLGVLKTIMVEDEILEAEALVESRTHRMYVKAQAICPEASTVYVVVAPGGTDARLPRPGDPNAPGGPPPTTPTG